MKRFIVFTILIGFLIGSTFVNAEVIEIRVLHVNDFHGFAKPYKPFGSDEMLGGISYLAAMAERLRTEKPTLLLAAGDMIQGSDWANLFQGRSVIELMNQMRFDAMVVGNHEFDFGQEVLRERISEARFPVLGANVEGMEALKPYVIKELAGIKIAIVGIVTEDTPVSTHPKNVMGLRFASAEETVQRYVNFLRDKADILLVLSHIGFHADRVLAEKVRGIDVIVGGHSHTKIDKPVQIGKTLIVQAWEHAKALGILDLTVEDGKIIKFEGHLEEIKPSLGIKDEAVEQIVKGYEEKADAALDEVVGDAETDLDGEHVRKRETNLGDLIADIMRETSGAEATIINGGGIRTSIRKGPIKLRDIYSVLPFDNYIVAVRLTGRQIREALEHGLSGLEEEAGRFPQVSGLMFSYDPSAPPGKRVREIRIAGRPVESDREYAVATNDFLAVGGDGYKAFGEAVKASRDFAVIGGMMKGERLVYSNPGKWLRDVVIDYIKARKKIAPKVEGRIKEVR